VREGCPTDSIQFGELDELHEKAQRRVEELARRGETRARLYGVDQPGTGGLHAFFLLTMIRGLQPAAGSGRADEAGAARMGERLPRRRDARRGRCRRHVRGARVSDVRTDLGASTGEARTMVVRTPDEAFPSTRSYR
jgi:hypothetical protein